MNRPNLEDEKYWGPIIQGDGRKVQYCLHEDYQNDLNKLIDSQQQRIKELEEEKEVSLNALKRVNNAIDKMKLIHRFGHTQSYIKEAIELLSKNPDRPNNQQNK